MEYISSFLKLANVSRPEPTVQDPAPDKGFVSALNELFTNHLASMITATLVCFAAFMGFTRMRTKHAAVLAPINAIWFTYLFTATSAGTIVLGLAGTATATSIASYFFRSHASDAARSFVSPEAVAAQLVGRTEGKKGATQYPAMGEAAREVLGRVQEERRDVPTMTATEPVVVPERTEVGSHGHDGIDYDELLRDLEDSEKELPRPQTDAVLDSAWKEATAPRTTSDAWASEFLSQNPSAREMVSSIPRKQFHSFDEVWGMVQRQSPGAKMNDPWVQEFMSEQCKRKGLPLGKFAKYAGVAAITVAAGYGLYKLYDYMTKPADEEREEERPKAVEQAPKSATEVTEAKALTPQERAKKVKQGLAMHLIFGHSPATKAFQGALKKRVEMTKAKAGGFQRATTPVEQQVEKKDIASRCLEVITDHTSAPG